MKEKKLVYVGFSFLHHGNHSGYNQIQRYVNYDVIIDCQKSYALMMSFLKSDMIIKRIYMKLFKTSRLWWVELRLIIMSLLKPNHYIFHVVYGENIFKYLGRFKFKNKVILTLHQPPSFYEEKNRNYLKKELKKVDKLIVMSSDMEEYFKEKFPEVKEVKHIAHGVEVNYFIPKRNNVDQILMIGNWLRNFEFASKVFKAFEVDKNIEIKVLTSEANFNFFNSNNNVVLLNGISDLELLNLYQNSKVVFVPVKQFTANNAILEACSCGCQVIVATPQQNLPQTNDSPIIFLHEQLNEVVDEIKIALKGNENIRINDNREYVLKNFSWELIGEKTRDFLSN